MIASPSKKPVDLEEELDPGEQLLWVGQPGQGLRLRRADRSTIPFTVLWAGFWVFWEYGALNQTNWFMRLWGIPFLIVGAWLAVGRFFTDARRRARTQYGLTDRRIIVLLAGKRSTQSIALSSIPALTVVEHRDGSGDIVLGAGDNRDVAIGGLRPKRSAAELPMLEFLPNPRSVNEMINSARVRERLRAATAEAALLDAGR